MKMMEILKLRIKCLDHVNPGFVRTNLRTMAKISRAAQEYYTSGMLARDTIYEIQNAQTHPYLYDGRSIQHPGADEIGKKYGLTKSLAHGMKYLALALESDIENGVVANDGTLNFLHANRSRVLMQHHNASTNGLPINGLGPVMQQMLSQYRARERGK